MLAERSAFMASARNIQRSMIFSLSHPELHTFGVGLRLSPSTRTRKSPCSASKAWSRSINSEMSIYFDFATENMQPGDTSCRPLGRICSVVWEKAHRFCVLTHEGGFSE